jgi:uncharacterized protein (TIGR02145 family)
MPDLSFDKSKTKALLIGISDYLNLPQIIPATGNVDDFYSVLTNPEIFGLPESSIIKILNKSHQDIYENIIEFFNNEKFIDTETLIFYYVGHGYREVNSKELYLTGVNSKSNSIKISAIPYNEIKQIIENNFIQKRIVIIDACHSGLATQDVKGENYSENELDIKGTYVLTSSASDEESFFESSSRNTFFTKELISVFKKGLPNNHQFLSLEDIYDSLQKNLKHSKPQRKSNLNVSGFSICLNTQYNEYSQLEKNADDLFENAEYERAKSIYLDIHWHKPNEKIKLKIEKCEDYIKVLNLAELKRKQKEEQIASEKAELKRKSEKERIAQEQVLKSKQEEEQTAKEKAELKLKQEKERNINEEAELNRKKDEQRIAREKAELRNKLEKERIAKEQEELKLKEKEKEEERQKIKQQLEDSKYKTTSKDELKTTIKEESEPKWYERITIPNWISVAIIFAILIIGCLVIFKMPSKNRGSIPKKDQNSKVNNNDTIPGYTELSEKPIHEETITKEINRDGYLVLFDNNTIKDERTGLMWANRDNGIGINWFDAQKFCKEFRGGGYDDWRMPTFNELVQLFDKSKPPYKMNCPGVSDIYTSHLLHLTCCMVWTIEEHKNGKAACVHFNYGELWAYPKTDNDNRVLPVRGESKPPSSQSPIKQPIISKVPQVEGDLTTCLVSWLNSKSGYFIDNRDQQQYKAVRIGSQVWMAENLKATKYRNGDLIMTTEPTTKDVSSETTPKYQWPCDGIENKVPVYGRLYTWNAVIDNRKLCPTGWHIPSSYEWTKLINFLGGEAVAGGKLKEAGSAHWNEPNTGADNSSGFTALPGGSRYLGMYNYLGEDCYFWIHDKDDQNAYYQNIRYNRIEILSSYGSVANGLSVRCIRN